MGNGGRKGEGKDSVMLLFASWHIRDFALLANTLIKILARGVGQNEVARTLVKCRLVCYSKVIFGGWLPS